MASRILSSNAESSEPVDDMGHHADLKKSSRNHQTSRTANDKILSPQASRNPKLRDKPKSERPISQSYTDLHHEIKQNVGDGPSVPPKSSENHQKQWVERKTTKHDELVKYMSNLPSYLQRVERGENLQEKALNFGVLDWGRLEKWKYNQKQIPGRSSMHSPSTSSTSLPFSNVGSSTTSSRNDSGTLDHQRKQSPSLRSYLTSSSTESHSQGVKPSRGNAVGHPDLKTVPNNATVGQQKLQLTEQSFGKNYSEIELERDKGKDSDPKIIQEMGTSSNSKEYEVSFCPKGKMKARLGESTKRTEQFQEFKLPDQHDTGRHKNIVLLLPRDSTKKRRSGICQQSESTTLATEANRKSFSDIFHFNKEVQFAELYSDIPHSCPLPCRVDRSKLSDMTLCSSVDALGTEVPSGVSPELPCSDEIPTVHKNAEENKSTMKSTKLTVIEPSNQSGPKAVEAAAAKGRNLSPNHRSSVMSRSVSSKECSTVPQLNSTYVAAKSGPVGSCLDSSNREKANGNSRARSSPLRRLLHPLLKPKAANSLNSAEPLQDESTSTRRVCTSSGGLLDSSTVQPVKRNLNFSSCGTTNADGSHQDEKHVALIQALLSVTVKDGHPSFRFEVDKCDFLLATMEKISTSGKYDCSWIYTFYSFSKIKKKSVGWMNQGSKGKSHDFARNIVGRMKVSCSHSPKFTRPNSKDQFMVREFVLFGVEQKGGQECLGFQPNNELAAIVVKVLKETAGSLSSDEWQRDNSEDLSEKGLSEHLPKERCSSNSVENLETRLSIGSQHLSSTKVILPSGVHGLPATGVPSPLIDRWRSGGSCDCGGWDVGCNLRILADPDECKKKLSSSKDFCTPDQFDLFIQGEDAQVNGPAFSLATLVKGIYKIDFNASITSLQAFSICIAILHCRKLAELSEVSNLCEEKTLQELTATENDRIKVPIQIEGEALSIYVPFPPLSPVGRV